MSLAVTNVAAGPTARQVWIGVGLLAGALLLWMIFGIWPDWLDELLGGKKTFVSAILNGVTLAGLYFLVASGFTLVFGLMRNVNLAHGSLFLLGAYIGYDAATWSGNWFIGVAAGALAIAAVGALLQIFVFQRLTGDDLRQTLVTIGISIVAADLMLAIWGGKTFQFSIPSMLDGAIATPIITAIKSNGQIVTLRYPFYRLIVLAISLVIGAALWLALHKTKFGAMIRAGVDDRGMLSATGVNVRLLFVGVFAIGGLLAGLSGVIGGSALSIAPGEDVRYLMASLVVVIVGGMGSITGAAIGALLIGLAEQLGLVYFPTYGVVLTFVIMVVTLAVRPQGIMGNARTRLADPPRPPAAGDIVPVEFTPSVAALAVALVLFPLVATPFVVFQLGAQTLILGMIALSLTILGGYGGMVSMAQLTVAGVAGYAVAILGPNGLGFRPQLAVGDLRPCCDPLGGYRLRPHRRHRGAHRRHLHDHDHARCRRRVLLPRPTELFAIQRPLRLSWFGRRMCSEFRGETPSLSTFYASPWRLSPIRRSSMPPARRLGWLSWRAGIIHGARVQSATMSPGCGSRPSSSQA